MGNATKLGWAAGIASMGQAIPGIVRQYAEDSKAEEKKAYEDKVKSEAAGIIGGLPAAGTVLEELAKGMSPDQAQQVLANTSPADQAQAAALLRGVKGLESMRLMTPKNIPEPAAPEGGALGALTSAQTARQKRNAFVNRFMEAVGQIESGGQNIGAHPRARNGAQAFGRYGVVPEFHAQRVGLDPSNASDVARFKGDPELQKSAAESFIRELGKKYNWDPVMMRRGYYGLTKDPNAPQFLADGRQMPSSNEDSAKFMAALGDVERPDSADLEEPPDPLPWDNSLLSDLVKDGPPKQSVMPKRVTEGDRLRIILSKVKNPDVLAKLEPFIKSTSSLAEIERGEAKDRQASFEKEQDRYGENVRKDSQLKFDTWKEKGDREHRARTYRDQSVQALRTQRDSLQKQLADIRGFQTRVAKGEESPEMLAAAYPNFFATRKTDPGVLAQLFQGDDAKPGEVTEFDSKRFADAVKALEADIQSIDEALSSKSGAGVSAAPAAPKALSKYLTKRN